MAQIPSGPGERLGFDRSLHTRSAARRVACVVAFLMDQTVDTADWAVPETCKYTTPRRD